MTNEEAIRTLRNAAWFISGSFSSIVDNAVGKNDSAVGEKIEKAVDMAVKALKAQEQLANNSPELANNFCDLISRNAAIDLWEKYNHTIAVDAMQYDAELRQLPSAHPEVRTQMSSADCISRQDAIDAADRTDYTGLAIEDVKKVTDEVVKEIKKLPSAQPEWNNHTVACMLAELFDDTCACNYNGIDEWLPSKCELLDSCPNPAGVACWEQFLKHRAERRTDEGD